MSETKKSVRPTWKQVRELQDKLQSQIDGTSRLVQDCNRWREKCREIDAQLKEADADLKALQRLHTLTEEELSRERRELEKERGISNGRLSEIERLKNRSLWQRIINI